MKEYTGKEIDTLFTKSKLLERITPMGAIKISYWLMFNRKKLYAFCERLELGMDARLALHDTDK